MTKQHEQLNKLVANLTVLYTKLHSFHWYVKGTSFYTLHSVFEKYYDNTTESLDEVAERFLAIGGRPVSTLKGSLAIATIQEATEKETTEEMVQSVLADFKLLIADLSELMESSEEVSDQGTADMALGIKTELEKNVWMLNAYLAK
ncbi:DNA starvation/stationary phase protection protein [Gemella sp. GH3]|uniref:Dps family protein n=1 Tax=unclassified Gemella TaxID=2624949 RepID=UPI0015D0C176|nr:MULTISPECIES: Dps family protein [unclassified Gemella]MBF0714005.1 DNA starvation/stationary phase protection protein [Gemella sp. GH3.1]NYS50957.1 DNA starvation/stationary phase protection protein [Gemella sp. GH3]